MKMLKGTGGEQRWPKPEPCCLFISSYKAKGRGIQGRARGPGSLQGDKAGPSPRPGRQNHPDSRLVKETRENHVGLEQDCPDSNPSSSKY